MNKICFKCKRLLPLTKFYAHPRMADGHLNKCKDCAQSDVMQNRRKRIQYYRKYDNERNSQEHRIARRKELLKEQKIMEPEKYIARTMAGNALRDGRLSRETHCYFCNSEDKLEMHHPDYLKPLRIYWLCTICHRKLDNMQKIGISNH